MPTLRAYDFDGVFIPNEKNHNNVILREIGKGSYPQGTFNQTQAVDLLRENPISKEAREWLDGVFLKQGVRFVESRALENALNKTHDTDGTTVIISASAFEGVINYMVEKAGLDYFIPPDHVFTVSSKDQYLIPGLKADRVKSIAEELGYTNIVFLDDNIKNVKKVGELDGIATKNGQLSVTAIEVDAKLGLEDAEVVERAGRQELLYNLNEELKHGSEAELEPIYLNDAEAVAAARAESEPIYLNNAEAVAAAKLEKVHSNFPIMQHEEKVLLSPIDQARRAVNFAYNESKSNPLYNKNLEAAQDVLLKLMNSSEQRSVQTDSTQSAKATAKSNPLKKMWQGVFSKNKNTSKEPPTKNANVELRSKRAAVIKRIKTQEVSVRMTAQDLFAQLGPVTPPLQNKEGAIAQSDLSKLTGASVELKRNPLPLPKDDQKSKGVGQEMDKGPVAKPRPVGQKKM